MTTKDLEAKIVAAIEAELVVADVPHIVVGTWQPNVEEGDDVVAVVSVGIGTPSSPTFTSPEVTFAGKVGLVVRSELDRDRSALVWFADKLCGIFKAWQSETYQTAFTALDLPELSVDEVSIGGGDVPNLDRANRTVSVSFPIVLSGTYR